MQRPLILMIFAAVLAAPAAALALPTTPSGPPPPSTGPLPAAVIYTVEEIAFGQLTPELREALGPVHTIEAAEEVLKLRSIPFAWRRSEALSSTLDPKMAQLFKSLPPREPLIIPRGDGTVLLAIVQQRPAAAGPAPKR